MENIYGIDLGTTNSMVCLHGELVTEMIPSIASIETKTAGESLRDNYDTSRSFKVNMSMGIEGKESLIASGLVLKELVRRSSELGHTVKRAVISVPAYFSDSQRQAVLKAADLIKLKVEALINEPTAAAIFYSKTYKGISVVFDLGGGTFDVSVIDSRFNNFDVQATSGLVVGGDNLDTAIVAYVFRESGLKSYHLDKESKNELKTICENAKIQMQKTRTDVNIDITKWTEKKVVLTPKAYKEIVSAVFGGTIKELRSVISSAIFDGDLYSIILVGGSSRCPFLQEMIVSETNQKPVPLTYDPDTVVAQGASVYAGLVEEGEADFLVSDVTKALGIKLSDGTMQNIIKNNSKIPCEAEIMVHNPVRASSLQLDLYQGTSALAVNNEHIGDMIYEYDEIKEAGKGKVMVTVTVVRDGIIKLKCKAPLKAEKEIEISRRGN